MSTFQSEQARAVEAADRLLQSLIGEWEGTNKTWFEPGVLADESPIAGTIREVPGSRFICYEYQSTLNKEPFNGMVIFGFNVYQQKFEAAWVDGFHMNTNLMFSTGLSTAYGFSVLGSYQDPGGGSLWGWRTAVEVISPKQIILSAYNIPPQGEESIAIETRYTRR
jgi:hypothetical protein